MKKFSSYKRRLFNSLLVIGLLFTGAFGSMKLFTYSYNFFSSIILENELRSSTVASSDSLTLTISEDATLADVADILHQQDFIKSKGLFIGQGYMYKKHNKLQPGTYTIENTLDNVEILDVLTTQPIQSVETIRLTIPEGYTIIDIANTVDSLGICSKNEFIKASNEDSYDFDFIADIPEDIPYRLEGYLFPDTYFVTPGTSATTLINMMLNRFEEIIMPYTHYLDSSAYTLHDIVTIASIIEDEARVAEERPMISGVIYNRLDSNMKLQMCSTVQYSLENRKAALTYEDLEVDSPYNTYLYPSLPVGPISCPGEASLQAAFMPDEHDYYFFVLKDTETGAHAFSKTGEEHGQNKQKYQSEEDKNFID